MKSIGARDVIDYKTEHFEDRFPDYNAVFDTVGGETYNKSFKVLKSGGIIVSMLEKENKELAGKYGVKVISQFTQMTRDRLEKLAELVEEGVIKVRIDKTFPLDKAAEALHHLEVGHPKGKIIIKIK